MLFKSFFVSLLPRTRGMVKSNY